MSGAPGALQRAIRWLASKLVAGPDARFILDDLEEAFLRDRREGRGRIGATVRYVSGTIRSAWATRRHLGLLPVSLLDLRLAVRMLSRHPVASVVAVLSMVVGIPVGLLPVLMVDSTDVPVPFAEGHRLVGVRYVPVGSQYASSRTTSFDLQLLGSFDAGLGEVAGFRRTLQKLTGDGGSFEVVGAEVSPSLFSLLEVPPARGRVLGPSDGAHSSPSVALLGHELWTARFGADPGIVGRPIDVSGTRTVVVGVMAEGFAFPEGQQLWLPLRAAPASSPNEGFPLQLVARLPEGATVASIEAELGALVSALSADYPESYERLHAEVVGLNHALIDLPKGGLRSDWFFYFVGVLAFSVLMVACLNIGLLMYARSVSRHAENAIRSALGASRLRIVGQVFAEVLVLAFLSTALGLWLLAALRPYLVDAAGPLFGRLPYWIEPRISPRLVVTAMALALCSALAASLLPAWKATKEMRGMPRSFGRITSILVIVDVAVAISMAGLVAGTLDDIGMVRSGLGLGPITAESILGVGLSAPTPLSAATGTVETFGSEVRKEIVDALEADPEVLGVGVASSLPRMDHRGERIVPEDLALEDRDWSYAHRVLVGPGFFEALEIPILDGRSFEPMDTSNAAGPVVVNESFVDSIFGGRSPVGRRFRIAALEAGDEAEHFEVIGLVPDAGVDILDPLDAAAFYEVRALQDVEPFLLGVRVASDPVAYSPRVREVVERIAPHLLFHDLGPLQSVYPEDWILMIGRGIGSITILGVLIALVVSGVYAILSFIVTSHRRELGVRRALGATAAHLVLDATREIRRNLVIGGLLGVPGAIYLYGIITEDQSAGLGIALLGIGCGLLVLILVGALGAAGPVRRALGVSPSEVMRS